MEGWWSQNWGWNSKNYLVGARLIFRLGFAHHQSQIFARRHSNFENPRHINQFPLDNYTIPSRWQRFRKLAPVPLRLRLGWWKRGRVEDEVVDGGERSLDFGGIKILGMRKQRMDCGLICFRWTIANCCSIDVVLPVESSRWPSVYQCTFSITNFLIAQSPPKPRRCLLSVLWRCNNTPNSQLQMG